MSTVESSGGPLSAGTDAAAQSLTRVLDTTSLPWREGCSSLCRAERRRRVWLRQNSANSPLCTNWTTFAIRCAPRIVQLIPRFFIRFAMSLSPLLSMVPRLRASGGASDTCLRQSIPLVRLDSIYALSQRILLTPLQARALPERYAL